MENKIPEKFRKSPIKSKFEKPNSGKSKTISKESEGPCWDLGNQDIELSNSMINHDTFKKIRIRLLTLLRNLQMILGSLMMTTSLCRTLLIIKINNRLITLTKGQSIYKI